MIELYILRAFASEKDGSGGTCGVIFDLTNRLSTSDRQQIAATYKLPEMVFIDSLEDTSVQVQIFTPRRELTYAGYPLVGTAWLLHQQGYPVWMIHTRAGCLLVRADTDSAFLTWPRAWMKPYEFQEMKDLVDLRRETPSLDISNKDRVILWAWSAKRSIVTRFTAPDHLPGEGISASIALALGATVGTPLQVEQGNSSVCTVVESNGVLEVGGHVVLDRVERLG